MRRYALDRELARHFILRRRGLRLTQNDVAIAAELSESTIAKLETLRLPYTPEHRAAIERALDEAETLARAAS